jgi:hypothetical protein
LFPACRQARLSAGKFQSLPTGRQANASMAFGKKKTINVGAGEFLKEIRHSINYLDKNLKKIKIVIE